MQECWVVTFVANNEPRVERVTVREYCVRVPSRARLGFVENDVAVRVETVCSGQSGDAGTHDGDPHLRPGPPWRPQLLPTQ